MPHTISIGDIHVPGFMYGTAWKEEETHRLTLLALEAGFRAIDTANQRRHYHELGVGSALREAYQSGLVTREALFLQTKFTFMSGQDHRLPYDPKAKIQHQVEQSFASSLEHLHTTYLDSYVLHGPSSSQGLHDADWEAWRAMEKLHQSGKTRLLGISNVTSAQLRLLIEGATVAPRFVQNRCYARTGWDKETRQICAVHGIVYQGFSLLTANRAVWNHASLNTIAQTLEKTPAQIIFRFAAQIGMLPLTGTSDALHMKQDLASMDFSLSDAQISLMKTLGAEA